MADYNSITSELDMEAPLTESEAQDKNLDSHGIDLTKKVTAKKAILLVFRSLVGIGILTIPKQIQEIGIIGAGILYPTIALLVLYSLDLMIKTADDIDYTGSK